MNAYIKDELTNYFLHLFSECEKMDKQLIPHSEESIIETINKNIEESNNIYSILFEHNSEASSEEMDRVYEFTQKIVEVEVGYILFQMDKEGLIDTAVNSEGEIVFKVKK